MIFAPETLHTFTIFACCPVLMARTGSEAPMSKNNLYNIVNNYFRNLPPASLGFEKIVCRGRVRVLTYRPSKNIRVTSGKVGEC